MPHKDPVARAAYLRSWNERNRDRVAAWEAENRDKRRAQKHAWHRTETARTYSRSYRERVGVEWHRRFDHGLVPGEWAALYEFQAGRCAICAVERPMHGSGCLEVDHDHATQERRGLLCKPCNNALGAIERGLKTRRTADWCRRASEYAADPPLRRMRHGDGLASAQPAEQEEA